MEVIHDLELADLQLQGRFQVSEGGVVSPALWEAPPFRSQAGSPPDAGYSFQGGNAGEAFGD